MSKVFALKEKLQLKGGLYIFLNPFFLLLLYPAFVIYESLLFSLLRYIDIYAALFVSY